MAQKWLASGRYGRCLAPELPSAHSAGTPRISSDDHDTNSTTIQAFVERLDAELDLVLVLERLDEGLVLLAGRWRCLWLTWRTSP